MSEVELVESYYMEQVTEINDVPVVYESEGELDGIKILVDMVKQGKIDPWNIDIVDVADKYLLRFIEMKSQNLRVTSRTLLFAAVLLRLKSNILEGVDVNQIQENLENLEYGDDFEPEYEEGYDQLPMNNVISLEEVLERRTSIRLNRNRVVTLKDLIKQLEFYEEMEKKRELKNKFERAKRRVRSYAKFTADDIINLAHDEYIEDSIEILHQNLIKIFEKEDRVELNTLTLLGLDKISAYIALLFLSVNTDYDLEQDEFYSDLYVVKTRTKKVESEVA